MPPPSTSSVYAEILRRQMETVDHPRHTAPPAGAAVGDTVHYGNGGGVLYNANYVFQQYGVPFALTNQLVRMSEPDDFAIHWDRPTARGRPTRRAQVFTDTEPEDL